MGEIRTKCSIQEEKVANGGEKKDARMCRIIYIYKTKRREGAAEKTRRRKSHKSSDLRGNQLFEGKKGGGECPR